MTKSGPKRAPATPLNARELLARLRAAEALRCAVCHVPAAALARAERLAEIHQMRVRPVHDPRRWPDAENADGA